jgi:hypothetical protein
VHGELASLGCHVNATAAEGKDLLLSPMILGGLRAAELAEDLPEAKKIGGGQISQGGGGRAMMSRALRAAPWPAAVSSTIFVL